MKEVILDIDGELKKYKIETGNVTAGIHKIEANTVQSIGCDVSYDSSSISNLILYNFSVNTLIVDPISINQTYNLDYYISLVHCNIQNLIFKKEFMVSQIRDSFVNNMYVKNKMDCLYIRNFNIQNIENLHLVRKIYMIYG